MVKRSRVISIPPLYRCPYCHKRFYSFSSLYTHAKHKHNVTFLTGQQYRVLLACRRLMEKGISWFCCSDVYNQYMEMFDDAKGKRLRNMIRQNLYSLMKKGILEMDRKHDILLFRVVE